MEILRLFVDEKDPKPIKRCPKCRQTNELWSAEERRKQLQLRMDQLAEEEVTMNARKKKYHKKHPLAQHFAELDLGDLDEEKGLAYKEHEMWTAKVDLDEYLDNEFFIPRSDKEVMDLSVKAKQRGNDALKAGDFQLAAKHYGDSIRARADNKPGYNNS